MMVLEIKEIRYVVLGMFDDLVGPLLFMLFVILSTLAPLSALIRP